LANKELLNVAWGTGRAFSRDPVQLEDAWGILGVEALLGEEGKGDGVIVVLAIELDCRVSINLPPVKVSVHVPDHAH
jgi:hypothetical protein